MTLVVKMQNDNNKDKIALESTKYEFPFDAKCSNCLKFIPKHSSFDSTVHNGEYDSIDVRIVHGCGSEIVIRLDPNNLEHVLLSGAERIESKVVNYKAKMKSVERIAEQSSRLQKLIEIQNRNHKDDYSSSCLVRKVFREEKKK